MAQTIPFTGNVDTSFKLQMNANDFMLAGVSETNGVLKSGDFKKIKAFVRSNHWPPDHEVRGSLWWKICKLKYKVSTSMYNELVTDLFGAEHNLEVSLPGFVDRSAMYQGHLSESGVKTAKKLMCVLGKSRPDVTFAPTLYTMACVLLHYLQEEQVFDTLDSLLRSGTRPILQTRISYQASAYILQELLKKYNRKAYVYMIQQHMKPEQVLSDWIWWLFRDLPFPYLVRIMDCYLFEGIKVLYRVTLAILRAFFDAQMKGGSIKTEGQLSAAISQFSQNLPNISIAALLKASFKIRGFSRKELHKLTVKQEMYVKSLANTQGLQPTFTSESKDKVTVSRSFSLQEMGSSLLTVQEDADESRTKSRSRSQGTVFVPFCKVKSSLLSVILWESLWQWLPERVRILVPELLFSTSEHGTSLRTFYSMVSDRPGNCPATIILIKTTTNRLIGSYCSNDWSEKEQGKKKLAYFGTGETFVFTLQPECVRYPWVGVTLRENTPSSAQYFQAGDLNKIYIGGGSGGVAITLDEDLLHGESRSCDTFDNPPLAGDPEFQCAAVEVFGFT